MSARGPRPLPTALKVLRGTARADRVRPDEPRALPVKSLVAPKWLDEEGRKAYTRLGKLAQRLRVLSDSDLPLLSLLADQWSIYRRASAFIREHGETYEIHDKEGKLRAVMPYPQVAQRNACAKAIHRMSAEFGLSPSGRTRVAADLIERGGGTGAPSPDEFERFLLGESA